MVKKSVVLLLAAGLVCTTLGITSLQADEGAEVIVGHPLTVYPNTERSVSTDHLRLLSKDPLAKIKKYYESNKQAGDRLVAYATDSEQGYTLNYYKTIEGKEQSAFEVQFTERKPTGMHHDALGELFLQTKLGKHTEAEYNAMVKEYKNLDMAYYRHVDDGEGGTVNEGEKIYRKTFNQAHDTKKLKGKKSEPTEEKEKAKEKAKELKKQMKELKAKGDIAGMMKLAQQSKMSPPASGAAAIADLQKDTWDLWVTCLKDLKAAAFWTKLEYSDAALPAQE